jgi:hypothetical protein
MLVSYWTGNFSTNPTVLGERPGTTAHTLEGTDTAWEPDFVRTRSAPP